VGQKVLTAEDLNNLLSLGKDIKERTAWHRAAENGKVEELRNLWEWVMELVKVAKADRKYISWQLAALMGNLQVF